MATNQKRLAQQAKEYDMQMKKACAQKQNVNSGGIAGVVKEAQFRVKCVQRAQSKQTLLQHLMSSPSVLVAGGAMLAGTVLLVRA